MEYSIPNNTVYVPLQTAIQVDVGGRPPAPSNFELRCCSEAENCTHSLTHCLQGQKAHHTLPRLNFQDRPFQPSTLQLLHFYYVPLPLQADGVSSHGLALLCFFTAGPSLLVLRGA
jgi:hypothetical protein